MTRVGADAEGIMSEKQKLIIDCDVGTDDAVAMLGLLLADRIDVIGITTVHGNLPVEQTTQNALSIVELVGQDIPVYAGCPHALTHGLFPGRTQNTLCQTTRKEYRGQPLRIHEPSLGLPTGGRTAEREHAVSFLVRTLCESTEPIDICAIGPLTNLAAAFILAPEVAKKIGTLYIMGGGIHIGNRTPVAEANFADDAEAAAKVMLSGANLLIGPIEANEIGATYRLADIEAIEALGSKTGAFVGALLRRWLWRCDMLWAPGFDLPPYQCMPDSSCCIHDWAAVAPAIDPATVTDVRREVCRVDCSGGMADGQLVIDRRGYGFAPNAAVVYNMDEARCKGLLLSLLAKC